MYLIDSQGRSTVSNIDVELALAAVDALPDQIALLNAVGEIIAVNDAWRKFAIENNYSIDNFAVGLSYVGVCESARGEDAQEARSAAEGIRRVLSGEARVFTLEYPCHNPTDQRWFLMRATRFEHNARIYVIVAHINITQRVLAEQQVECVNAEFRRKNEELEQFSYTVSHDLNAPLITFRGFADHIRDHALAGRTDRIPDFADRIKSTAERMRQTINGLLELGRAGHVSHDPEPVCMQSLVHDILAEHAVLIEERSAAVQVEQSLPTVSTDPVRIRQVFDNLIVNALKYGCVGADAQVRIGCVEDDGKNCFFVRDNGPGVPHRQHDTIFGLFKRLDTKTEGTGVGLAVVQRITETLGGRVWIESSPGEGATFWVTLP